MQDSDAAPAGLPDDADSECGTAWHHAPLHANQHSDSAATLTAASPAPRSPLHPITPRRGSPTAASVTHTDVNALESGVPLAQYAASLAAVSTSAQSTPAKKAPTEQLRKYKAMCAELAAKNEHFQHSCEHLQQENERLKAQQATGVDAGTELMADQLAQQLQHLMQEKSKLQRDKAQLESDNTSLLQLLDYARAVMDGDAQSPEQTEDEAGSDHSLGAP